MLSKKTSNSLMGLYLKTLLILLEKVGKEKSTFEMRLVREQRELLAMCSA
jgi:hypothetical protein